MDKFFIIKCKPILNNGFTLAEVLITLGIIGIIAALTIPNITSLYRKKIVETRLARFYSVINQAIKRSEVDNESVEYWGAELVSPAIKDEDGNITGYSSNTLKWYNRYLRPYLPALKVKEVNTHEQRVLVYFNDGSLLNFSSRSWIFYPDAKYYEEVEKNDGAIKDRDRTESGRRYFTFQLYAVKNSSVKKPAYGVMPYGQFNNLTDEQMKTNPELGCTTAMPSNERAYCTLLIAQNGWKIPKDYPLKF